MNKFKQFVHRFIFGEDEQMPHKNDGYIKAVTPNGKVEVTVRFDNESDFNSMKSDIVSLITNSFSEGDFR